MTFGEAWRTAAQAKLNAASGTGIPNSLHLDRLVKNKRQPHHPWTYRTQAELAAAIGVSLPFLNDTLLGKREPSGKVLEFLKLERVVRYATAAAGDGNV